MKNNTPNLKRSKTVIFEGAGWASAENNGVGNCRIRSTFENKSGEAIYLEFTGHESGRHSTPSMRLYKFPWHISHLFKMKDHDKHYTDEYKHLTRETMEYTKENILKFLNECLGCGFDEIVIDNEDWSGFSLDGKRSE